MFSAKQLNSLKSIVIGHLLLAHSIFSAETATSGFIPDAEIGITSFVKMFFGLIIVVIIIFAAGWLSKRLNLVQKFSSGYQIKNLATLSLTSREKVSLIEVGGQQILIGIAPGRVSRLHRFDENIQLEEINSTVQDTTTFADQFNQLIGRNQSAEKQ